MIHPAPSVPLCRSWLAAGLFAIAALCCTACAPDGYSPGFAAIQPRFPQLQNDPFAMPEGLPRPPDAKILLSQKAAKGGNAMIAYETHWTLTQLFEFYRKTIPVSGLVEDMNYHSLDEEKNHAMNLSFKWWPGQKALYINAADQAFNSARDVRMVSVQLQ